MCIRDRPEAAQAQEGDKRILLLAKIEPENNDPKPEDLYRYGTTATILQLIRLPDKTVKILVEGESRAQVLDLRDEAEVFRADIELIAEEALIDGEAEVLCQGLMKTFEALCRDQQKNPVRSGDHGLWYFAAQPLGRHDCGAIDPQLEGEASAARNSKCPETD